MSNPSPHITAAREARLAAYAQLGTLAPAPVDRDILPYPDWPTEQRQLQVVHTADTTVVLTDGLSDPFADSSLDPSGLLNGYGVELFVEMEGHIPVAQLAHSLPVNQLLQVVPIAVGIPDFEGMVERLQAFVLRTYLGPGFPAAYTGDMQTGYCLLGMESLAIPARIALNLQEIRVVSVKMITTEFGVPGTKKEEAGPTVRRLREELRASGEYARTPFVL